MLSVQSYWLTVLYASSLTYWFFFNKESCSKSDHASFSTEKIFYIKRLSIFFRIMAIQVLFFNVNEKC